MTKTNFRRIAFAVLIMIVMLSTQSWAQDAVSSYKVGERVEYRDRNDYIVWFEGTIVRLVPESEQVLIRWDPRADYPSYTHDGKSTMEQGYTMDLVRHIKARTADKPEDKNGGADATVNPANSAKKDKPDEAQTAAIQGGTGLMTKEEILGYMKTNGYVNGQPKYDQQVCRDLIEQIKRRGVKESLRGSRTYWTDDLSPITKNGCGSPSDDVIGATSYNIGTPTTLDWLFGPWRLYVFGGTVVTAPGDGYIHTKNEVVGEKGFLTINGNGTYTWKVAGDPPANINGTWRNATKEEMGLQGGAGIVLLKGERGDDWIAFKQMDPNKVHKEEYIQVNGLLNGPSYKRFGPRK